MQTDASENYFLQIRVSEHPGGDARRTGGRVQTRVVRVFRLEDLHDERGPRTRLLLVRRLQRPHINFQPVQIIGRPLLSLREIKTFQTTTQRHGSPAGIGN